MMKSETQKDYRKRTLRVLRYIQAHLDQPIGLEDLAGLACFSPYHFHRVFRGMVGEPLQAHIRRLRLERAAWQISAGDRASSLIEVALDAGYESHAAFTRAFVSHFGIPPSAFREPGATMPDVPSGVHYHPEGTFHFVPCMKGIQMNVEIKAFPKTRVAYLRHTGPYEGSRETWQLLMSAMGARGLLNGNMMLGLSHDDPESCDPASLRYDACIAVDEDFVPFDDIQVKEVGGGTYAMLTHQGPYKTLGDAYAGLCGQWLPSQGMELRDAPAIEIYLNNLADTKPAKLLTEIYVPVVAPA